MQSSKDIASLIFNTLKEEIIALVLKPGEELSEAGLCKRFNASRTPVRTALQRLIDINLVESEPYQYTRVSKIDISIAAQMIFLRSTVESKLISSFMNNATPFDLEDLEHIIRKQRILLSSSFKAADFYALDADFHSFFYEKGGCMYIWKLVDDSVHYTRLRMLDIVQVGDFISIVEEHERLYEMIKNKDSSDIPALMEYHFKGGLKRLESRSNEFFEENLINYKKYIGGN